MLSHVEHLRAFDAADLDYLARLLALVAVRAWNEVRAMVTGRYVVQDGD
jgi:hypothetical protein